MDAGTRTEIEAAVFRRLVEHFRENPDVQNIDLMELAGFCRNCLSKWYSAAAEECGEDVTYENARQTVYGMPYADWKAKFQKEQPADRVEADTAKPAVPVDGGECGYGSGVGT